MTGDVRHASRRGLCKPPQCIMVLKAHQARSVMNEQKPCLVEPSLWYFALSQNRRHQKVPSGLWARGGLKSCGLQIPLEALSLGQSESHSCFIPSELSKLGHLVCTEMAQYWGFFLPFRFAQPSEVFCPTWTQWCPFLVPGLFNHHRSSVIKLKEVILWLNCLFSVRLASFF